MANAIKCDRCGEFEESTPTNDLMVQMPIGIRGSQQLCSDCRESFKEWWLPGGDGDV